MSFLENVDRKKLQQILLIVLAALVCVALVLLLVIIINSISSGMNNLTNHTVTEKDFRTGSLILADEDHAYSYTFEDSELTVLGTYRTANLQKDDNGNAINKYYMNSQTQMKLTNETAAAAHKMLVAAEGAVKKDMLCIDSTYGYMYENSNREEYKTANLMFLAGMITADKPNVTLPDEYRAWLDANCAKYGFIESFEDGYRYVGIPHAKYMTEKKLTLAAYITELKKTSADKPLKIETDDGKYEVYFIACEIGAEVKVPEGATISGTNDGGIVITVKK